MAWTSTDGLRSCSVAVLLGCACSCAHSEPAPSHQVTFVDGRGAALAGLDEVGALLTGFYGGAVPRVIQVVPAPPGPSRFDVDPARVLIGESEKRDRRWASLVAHEASHVCLGRLTHGASTATRFRFIDEGLATLFEWQVAGTTERAARTADEAAALQLAAGNLSLEKMARWRGYFGTPGQHTAYAYPVAASFDRFLREVYGEERLRAFLEALGNERDLSRATAKALAATPVAVEAAWKARLSAIAVERLGVPSLSPANGATKVPTRLGRLTVTFNVDMQPTICVLADCKEGICYTGARWSSLRVLVILPDRALMPHHHYELSLGVPTCHFMSANGQMLPMTPWSFNTE